MNPRILIVDDNPLDRGMIHRQIRKDFPGAKVLEAINEQELAQIVDEGKYDLVVTDFHICWTDGLTVLNLVKSKKPYCPVLMFTATGNEDVAVAAMKSGLDDYIIKNPNHMIRLGASIRSALSNSRLRVSAIRLESRLDSLMRRLNVGIFRADASGTIIEANHAVASILGTQPTELTGTKLARFFSFSPDTCAGREMPLNCHDGSFKWISVSQSLIQQGDLSMILVDGMIEDLTSQRRAADELRRLQDEIAHVERVNTISEMATGIAHELKQPLHAIVNYASASDLVLEKQFPDATQSRDHMKMICTIARQASEVVNGLRKYSRRNGGKREVHDLRKVFRQTLDMLAYELRTSQVSVNIDLEEFNVQVHVVSVQIQQVLVNLITNAIQSILECGTENRILNLSASRDREYLSIQICDSGTGISEELIGCLFDPYVTSKSDGTGIGLPISSRIVKSHGGTLTARNNHDQGATFEFTLPIHAS